MHKVVVSLNDSQYEMLEKLKRKHVRTKTNTMLYCLYQQYITEFPELVKTDNGILKRFE